MTSAALEFLNRNAKLRDAILKLAADGKLEAPASDTLRETARMTRAGAPERPGAASIEAALEGGARLDLRSEAIVRRFGRPTMLVVAGDYQDPELDEVRLQLAPHRAKIKTAIAPVGRIEFRNFRMPWGGTSWLVEAPAGLTLAPNRGLVVTNRHVAELVAESDGASGFRFRMSPAGVRFGAQIDFREELGAVAPDEFVAVKIRFLAADTQPDIAILEIEAARPLPPPVDFAATAARTGQMVGVVGYPTRDSRNDPADVARYFGDIFDVKRVSFGDVMQDATGETFFMHDATTLGGNSGSKVFDLETGKTAGLHFAGSYLEGNYAVAAEEVKRALAGVRSFAAVAAIPGSEEAMGDGHHPPTAFKDRKGYDPGFLGNKAAVPLPGFGKWAADLTPAEGAPGKTPHELRYQHFSVVMTQSRKLPLVTAVNIDGKQLRTIPRIQTWFTDGRIGLDAQVDNAAYSGNDLDRGHMVRRQDPVWGTLAVAKQANEDTFHYTNAAPQHKDLNQRDWVGLEDYVLDSTRAHKLLVSVFTGPILRDGDEMYRDIVRIPKEFWKIAVLVDSDTGALSATGYVLSQGEFIEDLTEGFVFGEYQTYQVQVSAIEKATDLDFGILRDRDPLARMPKPEGLAPGATVFKRIAGGQSLVLR
jgi:endonuclease G, mitochondrial